ncbi:unnamed protein product [Pleuronectes platessa]|uniref:Uncharacterized protein n=1 Tax=Pleuronectes platessa TaxID=8262 RepID=A0A9N7VPG5_PLEPL|nr:unnamed protein product [Pleuronectes platessa]
MKQPKQDDNEENDTLPASIHLHLSLWTSPVSPSTCPGCDCSSSPRLIHVPALPSVHPSIPTSQSQRLRGGSREGRGGERDEGGSTARFQSRGGCSVLGLGVARGPPGHGGGTDGGEEEERNDRRLEEEERSGKERERRRTREEERNERRGVEKKGRGEEREKRRGVPPPTPRGLKGEQG